MTFKRPLSVSPSSREVNDGATEEDTQTLFESNLCVICGDKARIINYGAFSCQSCKTFFRRNGFRPESVRPCDLDKCCEINMQTRHNCIACRLAKCFLMGMSSELIRKEILKITKCPSSKKSTTTKPVQARALMLPLQLPTLNLLRDDRSLLTNSEWTIISNIVHAYDTYSIESQIRRTIEISSTLPVALPSNVTNPLDIAVHIYNSIQSFIGSVPDFRVLTVNEQRSLFDRNLHGIIGFCSPLFFRNSGILHNSECRQAFTDTYGSEIMFQANDIYERLDPDSTFIKIILIILAFSSNYFIVDTSENMQRDSLLYGTFRLFGSQNVYVEILWKYMIYRYGDKESIIRFTRLIAIILRSLTYISMIYKDNEDHQKVVDNLIEETKQSLNVNDNDPAPLWGKT